MKKNIFITLAFIFSVLLINVPVDVNAARVLCTSSTLSKMRSKAYGVKFDYEFVYDKNVGHYFKIHISNLTEELEVEYGGLTYSYNPDKSVITMIPMFDGGATYEFKIYAAYGYPCVGELLYTKSLKVPKYNSYSEYEECIEYEEFPLCNKWYQGDIPNQAYFYKSLNEYKETLIVDVPVEDEKESPPTIIEKILAFYVDNLIVTLPVTLIVIGGIIFVVVRSVIKKKNRVKIDI